MRIYVKVTCLIDVLEIKITLSHFFFQYVYVRRFCMLFIDNEQFEIDLISIIKIIDLI